jgi:hypothetical protein
MALLQPVQIGDIDMSTLIVVCAIAIGILVCVEIMFSSFRVSSSYN